MTNLAPTFLRLIPAALALLFALRPNHAGAAFCTWDPIGTSTQSPYYTGSGLNGTWENADWASSNTSSGQVTPVNWVENTAAIFAVNTGTGTPAFTVTMNANHTVAGIFDGSEAPNPCTVVISGTGTLILPTGATTEFDVISKTNDPGSLTIYNVIAGSPNYLEAAGIGSITLNGANTFSGGFVISGAGGVSFGNNAAFGTGTITWTYGGLIQPAQAGTAYNIANPMTHLAGGTETFSGSSGGVTFSGNWDLGSSGTVTIDNITNTITVSGVISDSAALITEVSQSGVGWTFTGTNTYSGATTISSGTLTIGGSGSLGSGSYAGAITNSGTLTYNSSASQTLSGVISGAGTLTQAGSGALALSAANTYTGVTALCGGTLQVGHAETAGTSGPLGKSAAANPGSIVLSGGTLQYSSANANDYSGRFSTAASQAYNIDVNGQTVTFATALTSSGGALTLSSTAGGGKLTLSAANTYTGGTTIDAGTLDVSGSIKGNVNNTGGTLKLDNASALASGATLTLASSPAAGAVNLSFSGTQNIGALYFGTTQKAAGTWAASGAAHNNTAFTGSGVLNVTTGPASSTAVSLTSGSNSSTYGGSLAFTATVTGSSPGGTVQFKVDGVAAGSPVTLASGSARLAISNLTVSGSPHQITAYYSGDDNNNPSDSSASPLSQTITPKALFVCGLSASNKTYDGTTSATLTGTAALLSQEATGGSSSTTDGHPYTGDTVSLSSTAASAFTGTFASKDAASGITVNVTGNSLTGAQAGDYTLSGQTTEQSGITANITAASSANNLTASPNPSLSSQPITFTATLSPLPPGAGTPAGAVLFKTNGVYAPAGVGTPIELNGNGVATLTLPAGSLPHGANTVAAEYAANGNFLGSTNSVAQIVNTPPIAPNTTASVTENASLVLSVAKLLSLACDADGDPLSITSASPTSTNGPANNVVLDTGAGTITCTPAANFVGTDLFSFIVSDSYGASSTGSVLVTVTSASVPSPNIVVPPSCANGVFSVTFAGIPGYNYTIQYSPNLSGGPWTSFTNLKAGDDGQFTVTDTPSPAVSERYYRTVYP
jgi:autotransporter-associated beta strand protein